MNIQTKPSNTNLKPEKFLSNQMQNFVHNHAWTKNQASIQFEYQRINMTLSKWVLVQNQNLRIKNLHKTCYWCMKTLNYQLSKSYKHAETKIESKRNLKLVPKIMFFRWTWRTFNNKNPEMLKLFRDL